MNPDWWKYQDEEDDETEYIFPEIRTDEKPISLEESVENIAKELLAGNTDGLSRKNVEYYMTIRSDHDKARNFLQLLLDNMYAEPSPNLPPFTPEEIAESYTWPNEVLEEIFNLDQLMVAVELLRSRGQ